MLPPTSRIASAYFVLLGRHGDVTRHARERGVCRQWLYREAASLLRELAERRQQVECLQARLRELERQHADCQQRLREAVVLDADKQAQFACVAQACGVSLPVCWQLLDVLLGGFQRSVATLGRATQAAGRKAGELLAVLDALARRRAREVAADEIYVKAPVLMAVEPDSLCWLAGRLSGEVTGEAWAAELAALPQLEQLTRDGGAALAKGVELLNAHRREQGQPEVTDQGDHYHALRGGGAALRQAEAKARQAFAEAEAADQKLAAADRQGRKRTGPAVAASFAWKKAQKAMDAWQQQERAWHEAKEALRLFTPRGELNTRQQATAALAEALPRLPDGAFAKVKRRVRQPEMLSYLERVRRQIEALPFPEEVKQAAVQQEGLRRRPELLRGETAQAAALRGVLLLCAVVLGKAGEAGRQAAAAVADVVRRAQRASSLVECVNAALRMQQARHRKVTQGLLDLERLYWNCHAFRSGRRRNTTPYELLGVPWPEGLRWWDLLQLTPEQLQDKLSTAAMAA
jgi:hypothetical protein